MNTLPKPLDVPELRWALGDLTMISQSKHERERYESRLKMQRDVYTALAEKLDEGRAEGWRAHIQYLQKALRGEIMPVEALQTLSLAELERLAARLQTELDAKLGSGS